MEFREFIECGRKRIGVVSVCQQCKKEFAHRKDRQSKYCSSQCSSESKKQRIVLNCEECGKQFERTKSDLNVSRHKKYFCSRTCKEKAQRAGGSCPEIRPSHYGTGWTEYRLHSSEKIKKGCLVCEEMREFLLTVHHIDGNRKNGNDDNLEVVCGKCHLVRHLRWNGNRWVHDPRCLTPRDIVQKFDKETYGAIAQLGARQAGSL